MTITNEQLNIFVLCGKAYLNNPKCPKSTLWYAVDKILRKAIKLLKKIEDKKNVKRRDCALKLDKGVFDTKDNGSFKYDTAGHERLVKELEEIDAEMIEISTHIVTDFDDNPELISFDMRVAFEGIVIPEYQETE